MPRYANGQVPQSALVTLASGADLNGGWAFQSSPGMAARWAVAKSYAEAHFGRTLHIRTGWNMYRPLQVQKEARARACASGNCNGAASPGYSSHGGTWNGRDALAIDVDPNGLSWAQVWEACRAAGFLCGAITEAVSGIKGGEPWHVIDQDPWRATAAGGGSRPFPDDNGSENDMGTLDNTEANYQTFAGFIQRAFRYDARPTGLGPNGAYGPTVFESLAGAQNADEVAAAQAAIIKAINDKPAITDAQVKAIADAIAKQLGTPTFDVDYAKIATAVRAKFASDPIK